MGTDLDRILTQVHPSISPASAQGPKQIQILSEILLNLLWLLVPGIVRSFWAGSFSRGVLAHGKVDDGFGGYEKL